MKNEVLLRYKRARWHSVIGDSSIHREGWTRHAEYLLATTVAQARTGFKAVSTGQPPNPYLSILIHVNSPIILKILILTTAIHHTHATKQHIQTEPSQKQVSQYS